MKAVIIAAGMGSRIWNQTDNTPKTLLPYKDHTILHTIMANFNRAGVDEFVVVLGYQSEYIRGYLEDNDGFGNHVEFVDNLRWEEGNGISVLVTEPAIGGKKFMLSMSDHVVSAEAIKRIVVSPSDHNLLLVDRDLEGIFDIRDATKVKLDGNKIIDISKQLTEYDGADCGIFRLNGRFFDAMRDALIAKQDSISAAISRLIQAKSMEAVFVEPGEFWFDVDTPEAYDDFLSRWKC